MVGPGSVPLSRRTTAGCEKCLQVVVLRRYLFLNLDRFRQSCRSQQVLNINMNNTMYRLVDFYNKICTGTTIWRFLVVSVNNHS